MALVVWVMVGIALWHFSVFVPDRFWGGIVGAFLTAIVGAVVLGLIANGVSVPGQHDTEFVQVLVAAPGCIVALAISYWWGARQDARVGVDHAVTHAGRG